MSEKVSRIRKMIRPLVANAITILNILHAVVLAPLAVIIILLRPLVLIRFGIIDATRIGHLCNVAGSLCLRDIDRKKKWSIDFVTCSKEVCNYQLKAMFARSIKVYKYERTIRSLLSLCTMLSRGDRHHFNIAGSPANFRLLQASQLRIEFTDDEVRRGGDLLEQLTIPFDAKWVCLHNRDSVYLDSTQKWRDWSYHSFRDFSIESMEKCAEEFVNRGYYVLRMGALTERGMRLDNPHVIDYANHPLRSEFGDLFLLGNCHLYFGSDSGIFSVAAVFKRPFAFVNYPTIESIYNSYYWNTTPFILKRAWHKEKERFLSIREVFEAGLSDASYTRLFEENAVELVDNTPEEICDLAIEVDERLRGRWRPKREDEERQRRFWDIVNECAPNGHSEVVSAQIGTTFLTKHADLLN